jgi:uncharacterized Fe-S radical SAM superfamily protein PflX
LVLPGHVECCHNPALELLLAYKDKLLLSVLDQYVPEHEAYLDSKLAKRPTQDEINNLRTSLPSIAWAMFPLLKMNFGRRFRPAGSSIVKELS